MQIKLKTKIWLAISSIVLLFTFFTLFYFPDQQGKLLLKNYNTEVQNLANTVALGVKIAITEQNFEGVQTAMEFVKSDPHLKFVSVLQYDTIRNESKTKYSVRRTVFNTFPESEHPPISMVSNDSLIIKLAPFSTSIMSGAIMLGVTTKEIDESKQKIRHTSLIVSGTVFLIGILLGFWLARNISVPVLALRDAAIRVGEGDLSHRIRRFGSDEIGELGKAFNKMTDDLLQAREELSETNTSLSETNTTLNNTLLELKSTQTQLIQSEKLASLGELTAGIAHEIQNPLNFINNFSEVNVELIEEMKSELAAGNKEETAAIIENIRENEQKITYHGKRADAIVKGMLQHSRSSIGKKEPADINALADEYLRLSYHAFRAKDKSFNAKLETNFDETLSADKAGRGNISIIPQDIGRLLLNLYNNAFYAVTEKKKQQGEGYEPVVSISTKNTSPASSGADVQSVEIRIRDNGTGIPQKVLDKIFQPFFTTKPAGQGTGLGLSLSYDIIKAHGGELKVETKEGGFTEFIICLPG